MSAPFVTGDVTWAPRRLPDGDTEWASTCGRFTARRVVSLAAEPDKHGCVARLHYVATADGAPLVGRHTTLLAAMHACLAVSWRKPARGGGTARAA